MQQHLILEAGALEVPSGYEKTVSGIMAMASSGLEFYIYAICSTVTLVIGDVNIISLF